MLTARVLISSVSMSVKVTVKIDVPEAVAASMFTVFGRFIKLGSLSEMF